MKYLVMTINGCQCPIIFPDVINHRDMHEALSIGFGTKASSAGFVDITVKSVSGESTTLKLAPKVGDEALLKMVARL